jgi:hypothetical protein
VDAYSIDSIVCPSCQAALDVSADVCPRCGAATTVDRTGAALASRPRKKGRLIDKPWLIVIVMLHVGFLGIPMYWRTNYSVATRLWLVAASIAYTLLAVGTIVLMLWWIASSLQLLDA